MIITRTPYRISFFGGGTDYPAWSSVHGGEVLSTSIDKYCYITCRHLPPFFDHKHRIVYSAIENGQGSFSHAKARVSIDNGAGSTVVIQVEQMSVDPRRYTLYFGTCINRDGEAVEIVAHEDYSQRDSERQAVLYKDGTHKMDAGPENRTK